MDANRVYMTYRMHGSEGTSGKFGFDGVLGLQHGVWRRTTKKWTWAKMAKLHFACLGATSLVEGALERASDGQHLSLLKFCGLLPKNNSRVEVLGRMQVRMAMQISRQHKSASASSFSPQVACDGSSAPIVLEWRVW